MPFFPFLGEGSPTKIDYRKTGTLILSSQSSLLEDLGKDENQKGPVAKTNDPCPLA